MLLSYFASLLLSSNASVQQPWCPVGALTGLHCRWNTPLDEEDVAPEEHRATWGQGEAPPLPPPAASRKRPLEDDDEIDEDVKRRLSALQGGGVD